MGRRDELVRDLRQHLDGALLALDFDGTLAPIVPDPQTSRLADGARAALEALVTAGARVAIVTGRDAETALRLSGLADLPDLVVLGLYGLQEWSAGTLTTPPEPPSVAALRPRLADVVYRHAATGIWLEDKGLSLVVHARRAADPDAALALVDADVRALAAELDLEVHPGRQVLEVRLPGYDKGEAVRRLLARARPAALLVAGDDLGDLPAFAVARDVRTGTDPVPAWTVGVGPELAGRAAEVDLLVDGPAEFVELMGAVASG